MTESLFDNLNVPDQVFMYNILRKKLNGESFDQVARLDETNGIDRVLTPHNHSALVEGYTLKEQLYEKARLYYEFDVTTSTTNLSGGGGGNRHNQLYCNNIDEENEDFTDVVGSPSSPTKTTIEMTTMTTTTTVDEKQRGIVNLSDLGITLLLANFAAFQSSGQYFLFVYSLNCIDEMDEFERVLLDCSDSNVKLPYDIALDRNYGLHAIMSRGKLGGEYYTLEKFRIFTRLVRNSTITVDVFLRNFVYGHDPMVVQGLYAFASFKRSNVAIYDCRHLNSRYTSAYKLPTIRRLNYELSASTYRGEYWFNLGKSTTSKCVWFVVFADNIHFKGYISREWETKILRKFAPVCRLYVTVGVLVDDERLYAIRIDNGDFLGNWSLTIDEFRRHGLIVPFHRGVVPSYGKSYFVKTNDETIYKYN